jgi:heme-degrading monooxygenase HmoA
MVFARLSRWTFKSGKRDESFQELDAAFGNIARQAKGYRGVLSLLSQDNPDVGLVITLWTDEESFKASETAVFGNAIQKASENITRPPSIEKCRVFTAELRQLTPP